MIVDNEEVNFVSIGLTREELISLIEGETIFKKEEDVVVMTYRAESPKEDLDECCRNCTC